MARAASLAIGLLVVVASSSSGAPSATPTPPSPEILVPPAGYLIHFDHSDRMTIPVQVNGGPILRFLIDTGAERTGVTKERATELTLASLGSKPVIGFAGRQAVDTVLIPSLSFARSTRANVEALTFSQSVIGADGFLGVDSLEQLKVDFDFLNERMTLTTAPRRSVQPTLDSVTVVARERHGRLIFAGARVEGTKVDVLLDTGSNVTVGNLALRERLVARGRLKKTIPVYIRTLTGELLRGDYGVVDHVLIDGVLINHLPIAFATMAPFRELELQTEPALFLGMDALRAFELVSVDFRHHTVRFVARSSNRPGTLFAIDGAKW